MRKTVLSIVGLHRPRPTIDLSQIDSLSKNAFESSIGIISFCISLNSGCWKETSDDLGFGGSSRDITSLAECQAACLRNKTCIAIGWQPRNAEKSCWILASIATQPATETVTHYGLDRDCLS